MGISGTEHNLNTIAIVELIRNGQSIEDLISQAKLPSLASCLNEMMGRKGYSTAITADMADINPASLHKIMTKKMAPSRNVLLRIAFALEMDFEETQVLLKSGNCAALSANRKRDLYIIQGIENKTPFDEVNEMLQKHDLPDLYSKG